MNTPEKDLTNAIDLAGVVGDLDSITALLGRVASVSVRGSTLSKSTLTAESAPNDDVIDAFLDFLVVRGYADEHKGTQNTVNPDFERVLSLLHRARNAKQVLDIDAEKRSHSSADFVCTLPSEDPSFRDIDPVDFGMQQVTTKLLSMCRTAESELVLTSPFLEAEGIDWLLPGLRGALERDVDVTLITRELNSGQPNREAIADLFESQVNEAGELHVYDYYEPSDDGGFPKYTLHSKVLVVDDAEAYVGSANFTKYGFSRNLEIGAVVTGSRVDRLSSLLAHVVGHGAYEVKQLHPRD
jgi:hypothetical protein